MVATLAPVPFSYINKVVMSLFIDLVHWYVQESMSETVYIQHCTHTHEEIALHM